MFQIYRNFFVGYYMTLSALDYKASNGMTIDDLEGILKEAVMAQLRFIHEFSWRD
jgi:hypothetical protein